MVFCVMQTFLYNILHASVRVRRRPIRVPRGPPLCNCVIHGVVSYRCVRSWHVCTHLTAPAPLQLNRTKTHTHKHALDHVSIIWIVCVFNISHSPFSAIITIELHERSSTMYEPIAGMTVSKMVWWYFIYYTIICCCFLLVSM